MEHIFIGVVIGALIMTVIYLLTRPYHESKKDDFLEWKKKTLVLESWKETQEVNAKVFTDDLKKRKAEIFKLQTSVESYEKSAQQIHNDYILINAQIAAVERRYADLVPVHRHYHLGDEAIKIKRVTNERHGRTDEKVPATGERNFAQAAQDAEAQLKTEAHAPGWDAGRASIPSYSPPGPGAFGVGQR